MSLTRVRRPLWRWFEPAQRSAAVRHARAGGIALVEWRLVAAGTPEHVPLFVDWAINALEEPRRAYRDGLVETVVPRDWRERVAEWLERDLAFAGATADATFDCTRCAACCLDNRVVLDASDRARFRASGQPVLKEQARLRVLPLARTVEKACLHLDGFLCSIYPHRPGMCRDFYEGTEQCLNSREEVFGTPFPEGR